MESSAGGSAQIYFGQKYFGFKSVFDPFQTQKAEGSAGGSAQIYFLVRNILSLKSVFDIFQNKKK